MKDRFLGTLCVLATVISMTATTAHADISSTSFPNSGSVAADDDEPAQHQATTNPPTPAPAMNSLELATYNLVNKYRQSRNLPPLVADPEISAQAKAHSEQMARSGSMSHDGFNERVTSVAKTIVYRSAAENVAYNMGYGQPDLVAVKGWIESPGHQHNMVGRYDLTGIGVAKNAKGEYYFTQIFIRKAWYVKDAD
ncbi:CAP domain-containing protein [Chamaesiphon sp.]|uniref:CAP domain-containing protein n=1 Tax=Chamaesiphon sp. TaxID=2814140 RepID=UPI00359364E7